MSSSSQYIIGLFAQVPSADQIIKSYCKEHYLTLILDTDKLEQLLWLQRL
jgi:hypothetical protein